MLRTLPSGSVHCCITSPPYMGLRDYKIDGQIGLEQSLDEYLGKLIAVFDEVKRVLRDDGTFWLNMGDSYAGSNRAGKNPEYHAKHTMFGKGGHDHGKFGRPMPVPEGLKKKDLMGVPWRLAFALQSRGWWLRCDIIWHKPSCVPLNVRDRPTTSHEYVFLLSKSAHYFYDIDAIREPHTSFGRKGGTNAMRGQSEIRPRGNLQSEDRFYHPMGRNKRSVWTVASSKQGGGHFASYPPALIEPCIKAGTSEKGCCLKCGSPMRRRVERVRLLDGQPIPESKGSVWGNGKEKRATSDGVGHGRFSTAIRDLGWERTCVCETEETKPCVVLDPFLGSGTTAVVAKSLGRRCVGVELNPEYVAMAAKRIDDSPR